MKRLVTKGTKVSLAAALVTSMGVMPLRANELGWQKKDGKWYYVSEEGNVTNWFKDGNCWYFFGNDGAMETGWHASNDAWYYLGASSGVMQGNGFIEINGNTYYLYDNGAMATDTLIDGKEVLANGIVVPFVEGKSVQYKGQDLKGQVIEGNLYISSSEAVVLDGVTVKGKIVVEDGTKVTVENSNVKEIVVNDKDMVVEVGKDATVEKATLNRQSKLEGKGEVKEVVLSTLAKDTVIDVKVDKLNVNTFEKVEINQPVKEINVVNTSELELNSNVEKIVVNPTAKGSDINIAKDVVVNEVVAKAPLTTKGEGNIANLVVESKDVVVDSLVENIEVKGDGEIPTTSTGDEVATDKPAAGGGGGGGAGGSGGSGGGGGNQPVEPEKPETTEATVSSQEELKTALGNSKIKMINVKEGAKVEVTEAITIPEGVTLNVPEKAVINVSTQTKDSYVEIKGVLNNEGTLMAQSAIATFSNESNVDKNPRVFASDNGMFENNGNLDFESYHQLFNEDISSEIAFEKNAKVKINGEFVIGEEAGVTFDLIPNSKDDKVAYFKMTGDNTVALNVKQAVRISQELNSDIFIMSEQNAEVTIDSFDYAKSITIHLSTRKVVVDGEIILGNEDESPAIIRDDSYNSVFNFFSNGIFLEGKFTINKNINEMPYMVEYGKKGDVRVRLNNDGIKFKEKNNIKTLNKGIYVYDKINQQWELLEETVKISKFEINPNPTLNEWIFPIVEPMYANYKLKVWTDDESKSFIVDKNGFDVTSNSLGNDLLGKKINVRIIPIEDEYGKTILAEGVNPVFTTNKITEIGKPHNEYHLSRQLYSENVKTSVPEGSNFTFNLTNVTRARVSNGTELFVYGTLNLDMEMNILGKVIRDENGKIELKEKGSLDFTYYGSYFEKNNELISCNDTASFMQILNSREIAESQLSISKNEGEVEFKISSVGEVELKQSLPENATLIGEIGATLELNEDGLYNDFKAGIYHWDGKNWTVDGENPPVDPEVTETTVANLRELKEALGKFKTINVKEGATIDVDSAIIIPKGVTFNVPESATINISTNQANSYLKIDGELINRGTINATDTKRAVDENPRLYTDKDGVFYNIGTLDFESYKQLYTEDSGFKIQLSKDAKIKINNEDILGGSSGISFSEETNDVVADLYLNRTPSLNVRKDISVKDNLSISLMIGPNVTADIDSFEYFGSQSDLTLNVYKDARKVVVHGDVLLGDIEENPAILREENDSVSSSFTYFNDMCRLYGNLTIFRNINDKPYHGSEATGAIVKVEKDGISVEEEPKTLNKGIYSYDKDSKEWKKIEEEVVITEFKINPDPILNEIIVADVEPATALYQLEVKIKGENEIYNANKSGFIVDSEMFYGKDVLDKQLEIKLVPISNDYVNTKLADELNPVITTNPIKEIGEPLDPLYLYNQMMSENAKTSVVNEMTLKNEDSEITMVADLYLKNILNLGTWLDVAGNIYQSGQGQLNLLENGSLTFMNIGSKRFGRYYVDGEEKIGPNGTFIKVTDWEDEYDNPSLIIKKNTDGKIEYFINGKGTIELRKTLPENSILVGNSNSTLILSEGGLYNNLPAGTYHWNGKEWTIDGENPPVDPEVTEITVSSQEELKAALENSKIKTINVKENTIIELNQAITVREGAELNVPETSILDISTSNETSSLKIEGKLINYGTVRSVSEIASNLDESLRLFTTNEKGVILNYGRLEFDSTLQLCGNDEEKQTVELYKGSIVMLNGKEIIGENAGIVLDYLDLEKQSDSIATIYFDNRNNVYLTINQKAEITEETAIFILASINSEIAIADIDFNQCNIYINTSSRKVSINNQLVLGEEEENPAVIRNLDLSQQNELIFNNNKTVEVLGNLKINYNIGETVYSNRKTSIYNGNVVEVMNDSVKFAQGKKLEDIVLLNKGNYVYDTKTYQWKTISSDNKEITEIRIDKNPTFRMSLIPMITPSYADWEIEISVNDTGEVIYQGNGNFILDQEEYKGLLGKSLKIKVVAKKGTLIAEEVESEVITNPIAEIGKPEDEVFLFNQLYYGAKTSVTKPMEFNETFDYNLFVPDDSILYLDDTLTISNNGFKVVGTVMENENGKIVLENQGNISFTGSGSYYVGENEVIGRNGTIIKFISIPKLGNTQFSIQKSSQPEFDNIYSIREESVVELLKDSDQFEESRFSVSGEFITNVFPGKDVGIYRDGIFRYGSLIFGNSEEAILKSLNGNSIHLIEDNERIIVQLYRNSGNPGEYRLTNKLPENYEFDVADGTVIELTKDSLIDELKAGKYIYNQEASKWEPYNPDIATESDIMF